MADHQKWLQKWLRIRKDLSRQTESEVWHRLGKETVDLKNYRAEYDTEFNKKWQVSDKDELLQHLLNARLILLGDFHALQQSQKAHLRVLKQMPDPSKIVLGLECFEAADQAHLDRYFQGRGSEREFLKAVQWQKKWGFPWENYKPLIRWAQKNKVKVYGLNRAVKQSSARGLKQRDQFAAQKISEILKNHAQHTCFVVYGDLHLAQAHLPAEILKLQGHGFRNEIVRIFQNAEKIYFQLLNRELESSVDLVKFSRRDFCLMSVPPWVKWQNYLLYLEKSHDVDLQDEDDILDYTDYVGRYVRIISEELGAGTGADELSVYTAQDPLFWEKLQDRFSSSELKWLQSFIEDGISFYIPELKIGYLARTSVNHASSLAMQFVHAQLSGRTRLTLKMPDDFLRQIWIEGVTYFGSKMINHKRKTDTVFDLKASLASRHQQDQGKDAMMLALAQKMHELMVISGRSRAQTYKPRRRWSYQQAAALLGGMLGERLYNGYRKKVMKTETVLSLVKKPVDYEKFELLYYELLEVIEALPAPFRSKTEKL